MFTNDEFSAYLLGLTWSYNNTTATIEVTVPYNATTAQRQAAESLQSILPCGILTELKEEQAPPDHAFRFDWHKDTPKKNPLPLSDHALFENPDRVRSR